MKQLSVFVLLIAAVTAHPHAGMDQGVTQRQTQRNEALEQCFDTIIKQQYIQQCGMPEQWLLMSYASVAGMEHCVFAKVCVGNNKFAHLRINMNTMEVEGIQANKGPNDDLEYFEATANQRNAFPQMVTRRQQQPMVSAPTSFYPVANPEPQPANPMADSYDSAAKKLEKFQSILDNEIINQFCQQTGKYPDQFKLVLQALVQIDACTYLAKVKIGDCEYAHLKIVEPAGYPATPMQLAGVQLGKDISSPMEQF